ncbi:hypothetical protein FRB98_008807 [Tulasnella sp. 332]|nr:hypothetical protein FRB98_008807 [Tulasnella sp. 332]
MDVDEDDIAREPLLREELEAIPVYPIIHLIKADVQHYIDTPLSYDALMGPDLTYSLVQPLYEKYSRMRNYSTVFCFLVNRVKFQRDQALQTMPVSMSRAALCEIIAIRLLRDWAENTMDLAVVMTTAWCLYSGAGPDVMAKADENTGDLDIEERVGNAIEMAIIGQAKRFIKSGASQKIIDGIWSGTIVYQAQSDHSFLSDTYKRTPIHFYNPRKAPLLDHYRLKVPAIRSVLEYMEFIILFSLYVIALEMNEPHYINIPESMFMIYALGFTLEKFAAMQEHGMKVYSANLWNAFDLMFMCIFVTYGSFRTYGMQYHANWAKDMGIDVLALGACLMFPRLAFVSLSNNLMILSLRSMFFEFVILMLVAMFCFCGFLYALFTLSKNTAHPAEPEFGLGQIAWWMLDLYFGLDASGFDKATAFHKVFGPILMIIYACLSNTLLLTVMVSIMSNTFATISSDAVAESMFRRAVSTIEGVKTDALFSYQPPLNLFAFAFMLPMSFILNRRWFHKVNVFMIRVTSFPILLLIAVYERQKMANQSTTMRETVDSIVDNVFDSLPKRIRRLTIFDTLVGTGHDIDTVFDVEEELQEEAESRRMSEMQITRKGTASSRQSRKETKDETKLADKFTQNDYQTTVPSIRVPILASEIVTPISSPPKDIQESASIPSQVFFDSAARTPPPQQPPPLSSSQGSPALSFHDRHLLRERERRKSQRRDHRPSVNTLDTGNPLPGFFQPSVQDYAPSPLARIFQPIVLAGPSLLSPNSGPNVTFDSGDEEAIETGDEGHSSVDGDVGTGAGRSVSGGGRLQGAGIPISFGPVSRRISASRQKLSQIGNEIGNGISPAMRRRTQSAVGPRIRPGLLSVGSVAPLTAAPPEISISGNAGAYPFPVQSHLLEPETVTEIEGEDDSGGRSRDLGEREWRDRLGQIEERQQRMEKMLEMIADKLAGGGGHDGAARHK